MARKIAVKNIAGENLKDTTVVPENVENVLEKPVGSVVLDGRVVPADVATDKGIFI